jgi:hypothetical protein
MITKRRLLLLLPLALVLVFGCAGNARTGARVSGSIKYKGQPVTAGSVTIYPSEGGSYSTPIEKDGTYKYGGLSVGEVALTVETETANPNRPKPSQYGGRPGGAGSSPPPKDVAPAAPEPSGAYVKIPAKYGNRDTAKLTTTLKSGANTYDLELTD